MRLDQLTTEQQHRWRERAGIAEYDGGMTREAAEAVAWADVMGWR